jgi:hypothetical protein
MLDADNFTVTVINGFTNHTTTMHLEANPAAVAVNSAMHVANVYDGAVTAMDRATTPPSRSPRASIPVCL